MVIPPTDGPLDLPAGQYTLFVIDQDGPPWTLIVSRKTGKQGMPYPGQKYDLGRTQMGSDDVSNRGETLRLVTNSPIAR
jgi:hypothetical protein